MALNRVSIMGRITKPLEMRQTPTGVSVTQFSIAVDRDYKNNGERETDFYDCVAWRSTAEHICRYFDKGRMIVIDGKLQTALWKDKEEKTHKAVKIIVDSAYFGDSKKEGGSAQSAGSYNTGYPYSPSASPSPTSPPKYRQESIQEPTEEFPTMNYDEDDLPF